MYILNIISIVFGLVSWILPLVVIVKRDAKNICVTMFSSLCLAVLAILSQIIFQTHLVKIEEWSAFMDTSPEFLLVDCALVLITIALNAILLVNKKEYEK